jgi:uncharacterized membrane protein YqjE
MTPNDKSPAVLDKPENSEWPALVGRIIGDVTHIIHTEIRLFQASLNPILSTAVDRLIGNILALLAFVVGGVCLLIALVVFLHRWIGWDAALLVTGVVSLIAGYACSRVATIRADRSIAELERTFAGETPAEVRH